MLRCARNDLPRASFQAGRRISVLLILSLLLVAGAHQGVPRASARPAVEAQAPGQHTLFLPLVARSFAAPLPKLCRFGVGGPHNIADYPVHTLGIGWYTDWWTALHPARPGGIEYLQMIRLEQTGSDSYRSWPSSADLPAMIAANRGSRWVVGNEPDRRTWQDSLEPHLYARAYHDLYELIKANDPTALIVAGSIVQPTPLRLQYLDMVLDSYRSRYGEPMPVDIWNIHAFILRERSCKYHPEDCWGAEIPPGIDAPEGMLYEVEDNDRIDIFQQFVRDFRQWMADRGYQDRPLIITEFGVLMPQDYGFGPARVNAFMNAAFDYLSTATGPTGYEADRGRLVQAWAWYSLTDKAFNGWLYDANTRKRTVFGDNFARYTAGVIPTVNLAPARFWAVPDGQTGITLWAQVVNNGNVAVTTPIVVRFYDGDPRAGGTAIAAEQVVPALDGCAAAATVHVPWNGRSATGGALWVVVDPDNTVAENDESDNALSIPVSAGH